MKKKILIAPLNWGLGHATRCIPIIKALEENGYEPIIASDGVALALLKKEFPKLISIELPSYNIQYAEKGKNFKWKMVLQLPKIVLAIKWGAFSRSSLRALFHLGMFVKNDFSKARMGVVMRGA